MPDINMLGSLRKRLSELGSEGETALFGKRKGRGVTGPILGAFAAIWLLDKMIVEKAHKATQESLDRMYDTSGANLNVI